MDRGEKREAVAALQQVFSSTTVVVVCHYAGLTVAQMSALRRQMRTAGASVKVAKNRLAKIALEGTEVASIGGLLKGPTLIAYSTDPVAAPKVASDFAKANEKLVPTLVSIGGQVLSGKELEKVASLPTREQALSQLLGLLKAPIEKLVRTLAEPQAKLVRTIAAVRDQKQAAGV